MVSLPMQSLLQPAPLMPWNLFLAGIVLGIYFIFKRNLWFSVGLHLTWNFFQGPIYGFEVSGQQTTSLITQEVSGSSLLSGGLFGFEGSLLTTLFCIVLIITLFLQFRTPKEKTPMTEVSVVERDPVDWVAPPQE